MGKPLVNRIGLRYGRLVVMERAENYRGNARWKCKCDCGAHTTALGNDLQRGKMKSCGCWNAVQHFTHGMSYTRLHGIWRTMRERCNNPKSRDYGNYGGRGIKVCARWDDFKNFAADMGDRPIGHSIDRIDNSRGYEPENCRWATTKQQLNNTRRNRVLSLDGREQTLSQWAEELNMDWFTLRERLRLGWSVERALTQPVKQRSRNEK